MARVKEAAGPQFAMYAGTLTGAMQGDVLTLTVAAPLIQQQLEREKLPALFAETASAMLGRPVRAQVRVRGAKTDGDPFDDLVSRGGKYSGLVDIQ